MQRKIGLILETYGVSITRTEKEVTYRGFFQPVRSKSWQSLVDQSTPLGEVFRGQYIYIGPADVPAADGDVLTVGGKSYFLRRVELYFYGEEPVYTWGMCVEKGVNDTWGSRS